MSARRQVSEFKKKYGLKIINSATLSDALKEQGYTIIEFSDALYKKPPQSPAAMVISMLWDDWKTIRVVLRHLLRHSENQHTITEHDDAGDQNACKSAERGAFERFYASYLCHPKKEMQFNDLSLEISAIKDGGMIISNVRNTECTPTDQIPEPINGYSDVPYELSQRKDSPNHTVQHKGRSLNNALGSMAFAGPAKEPKGTGDSLKSGNLPKPRT